MKHPKKSCSCIKPSCIGEPYSNTNLTFFLVCPFVSPCVLVCYSQLRFTNILLLEWRDEKVIKSTNKQKKRVRTDNMVAYYLHKQYVMG